MKHQFRSVEGNNWFRCKNCKIETDVPEYYSGRRNKCDVGYAKTLNKQFFLSIKTKG